MEECKPQDLVHNGFVLVKIQKGMYGLPQSGILAYECLVLHHAKYGYAPVRHTPGLWHHVTCPILFALYRAKSTTIAIDNFGVQAVGRQHGDHLLSALHDLYTVTSYWTGTKYIGLTLAWDYKARTVDVSMPGCIDAALHCFQHTKPDRPKHSPHLWVQPTYGAPIQLAPLEDSTPKLDVPRITRLQQDIGTLLFYARAVDPTMLVLTLGTLAAAQARGTEATAKAPTHLLNYAATHSDANIRYSASDMILHVHSDASYLSEPKARSRVGGHFYLRHHARVCFFFVVFVDFR
jgi:hypothetical protein